jgi:mRNA interferase RelE/StbE
MPIKHTIVFAKSAQKALYRISQPKLLAAVLDRITSLTISPRPVDCKVINVGKAPTLYRIREGDYRIIYTIRDEQLVILVVRIGHRKDVYRNLKSLR